MHQNTRILFILVSPVLTTTAFDLLEEKGT